MDGTELAITVGGVAALAVFLVVALYQTLVQRKAVQQQGKAMREQTQTVAKVDVSIELQREGLALTGELVEAQRETNRLLELLVKNEKSDSN